MRVYIEPARSGSLSHKVALLYGAVRNAEAYGVNLRWLNPRGLSIEYLSAKWTQDVVDRPVVDGESFSLNLRSGVTDASAPPGGMLYNLEP